MPSKKNSAEAVAAPAEDVSMVEASAEGMEEVVDGNPAVFANDEQRIRIVCFPT